MCGMNRFVCLRKMLFAAMAFIALSGCAEKAVQEDKAGGLQISPSVAFAPRDNVAGVVDNSMIESLTFTFARGDAGRRGQSDTYSEAAISAACVFPVGEASEATVIFDPVQYYNPDGRNTMMQGWYPSGTYSLDESGLPQVDINFNGNDDIIVSQVLEGNGSDRGVDNLFEFRHELSQIQFEVIAESELAAQKWGKVLSITLSGESNKYTNWLLSDVPSGEYSSSTFSGNADLQAVLVGQEIVIPYENASPAGMVMIEPRTVGRAQSIELLVETTGNGVAEVSIDNESFGGEAFDAGIARKMTLRFLQGAIEIVLYADAVPWETPAAVEHNVGENQPYVRDGENYIVTKNMFGNASGWTVREDKWDSSTDYSGTGDDSVPAVLEVYAEDSGTQATYDEAFSSCASLGGDWRLPCRMELQLIAAYKDELDKPAADGGVKIPGGMYWSATKDGAANAYYVDMADYESPVSAPMTDAYKVRCVRDIVME